jgi:hypothetical protein
MLLVLLQACQSPVIAVDYLALVHISPPSGAVDIDPQAELVAAFSEGLVAESVARSTIYVVDDQDRPADVEVVYDEDAQSVVVAPVDRFEYDTVYTFVLSGTLQGETTGLMPVEVTTRFRTAAPGPGPDNLLPIANAGPDVLDAVVGVDHRLDGTLSWDPEGQPLDFDWREVSRPFGSSTFVEVPDAPDPIVVPDMPGTYVYGLVVGDGYNESAEDYVQIVAPDV